MVPLPWALPHKALSWPFLPGISQGKMLHLSCMESPLVSAPVGKEALGLRFGCRGSQGHQGGQGHFKKIKVISCCSCWQGPVRPEPGGLKQFHNPGDFLLIGIMKPITNIKSHSLKQQAERGRDGPGPSDPRCPRDGGPGTSR